MKKLTMVLIVLIATYGIGTLVLPMLIDNKLNGVLQPAPYSVSAQAQALYDDLEFVGDLHCDALLWDRNLLSENPHGQVDIPRMQEGGMTLQAFTIVTKSPRGQNMQKNTGETDNITALMVAQGRSMESWFSLYQRAIDQCQALHRTATNSDGKFIVVHNRKELSQLIELRKIDPAMVGGFLGVEGAHCLEGRISNVDSLFDAGVRMMGATHFFDNELGGSAHGVSGAGLTDFGKQVITRMNELGMIIDLAHVSPAMIDDILTLSTKPVLTSHTGVRGTFDSQRNLSDTHIRGIAAKDGLIGIAFFAQAVGGTEPYFIVAAMKHVRDLVGAKYVALGSDFDGSVTTHFDCTGLPLLVEEMQKQGFTEQEIRSIMGENMKRFLMRNLP